MSRSPLDPASISEIIEMALSDHVSFRQIQDLQATFSIPLTIPTKRAIPANRFMWSRSKTTCIWCRSSKQTMRYFSRPSSPVAKQPGNIEESDMSKLDAEEREILEAFETGRTSRAANAEQIRARHQDYAAGMLRKDARINIRLPSKDLRGLQKKALAEGIPYQTLIASILHKYVEGRLHEDPSK